MRSRLWQYLVRCIQVCAALAAILAIYEYLLGRQTVPTFAANFAPCIEENTDPNSNLPRLRRFLTDYEARVIFVDLILNHDFCPLSGSEEFLAEYPDKVQFTVGFDTRYDTEDEKERQGLHNYSPQVWEATITITDAAFDESPFAESSFGDGLGAQRVRGLVYIINRGDEFLHEYELIPVPFSFSAERVYNCTSALNNSKIDKRIIGFLTRCILS